MNKMRNYLIPIMLLVMLSCQAQDQKSAGSSTDHTVQHTGTKKDTIPTGRKVVPWSQAKKEYLPDPNGNHFRVIEANNGLSTRQEGIEFLDTKGNVTKSYELRTAPFAPAFLSANERNDETAMREEFIWIDAKNMSSTQKSAALNPTPMVKKKSAAELRFTVTNMRILTDQENDNQYADCVIILYTVENYLKDATLNINTRLVMLDKQGNVIDIIDHIPYGINDLVLSDDLRYICYNYADMAAVVDYEDVTPTGLRLYDRKSNTNVIDRTFGTAGMGVYPERPEKIGDKIMLSCNGNSLGLDEIGVRFFIHENFNCIFRKDFKRVFKDQSRGIYYEFYIKSATDSFITYVREEVKGDIKANFLNGFTKMTFEEFNNMTFNLPSE